MKTTITRRGDQPVPDQKAAATLSRRQVLQTAIAGGIAASVSVPAGAATERMSRPKSANDTLEELLSRYGTEFGHLDHVG